MRSWNYSAKVEDDIKVARAVAREVPVSVKKVVNLARALKGMSVSEARRFLEDIIEGKEYTPMWRHRKKIAHHRGVAAKWGVPQGKRPVKAAKYLLKLLDNVVANAENKGLGAEELGDFERNLKIIHIAAHKGFTLKRYMPRAFGRSSPKFRHTSNIEIIVRYEGSS